MGSHAPSARQNAVGPSLVLALLAFLACLVCTGFHHVPGGSATSGRLAAPEGAELALGKSAPEPAGVQHSNATLPSSEREALQPDDVERDAGLEVGVLRMDVFLTALPTPASQVLHATSTNWMPQSLLSPALPRGPPPLRC